MRASVASCVCSLAPAPVLMRLAWQREKKRKNATVGNSGQMKIGELDVCLALCACVCQVDEIRRSVVYLKPRRDLNISTPPPPHRRPLWYLALVPHLLDIPEAHDVCLCDCKRPSRPFLCSFFPLLLLLLRSCAAFPACCIVL